MPKKLDKIEVMQDIIMGLDNEQLFERHGNPPLYPSILSSLRTEYKSYLTAKIEHFALMKIAMRRHQEMQDFQLKYNYREDDTY